MSATAMRRIVERRMSATILGTLTSSIHLFGFGVRFGISFPDPELRTPSPAKGEFQIRLASP